jgi:hypothetical protein
MRRLSGDQTGAKLCCPLATSSRATPPEAGTTNRLPWNEKAISRPSGEIAE